MKLALLHRPLDVRDVTFEDGVDTFERNERRLASTDETMALPNMAGPAPATPGNSTQPLDFGVVVVDPADLPHVDMRR